MTAEELGRNKQGRPVGLPVRVLVSHNWDVLASWPINGEWVLLEVLAWNDN